MDLKAAEVSELDDTGLARVVGGEPGESFINGCDFIEAVWRDGEVIVHLYALQAARTPGGAVLAGIVDENLAHDVSGESDELGAAAPVDILAGKAEVGFIDERGGLQRVVGSLAAHVGLSETVQLGVRVEAAGRRLRGRPRAWL